MGRFNMWEKIARPADARQLRGDIPVHHRYTLGVAGERFFKALRDERVILATRCPKCGEAFLPPKMYCEGCFEETSEWVPVTELGYVKSFTVLHHSLDEERLEKPEIVALIAWEGVRGGIIHRLGEIRGEVRIGMAVEPVWAEERKGSPQDIVHFRPAS
jgi:hypothetical protein